MKKPDAEYVKDYIKEKRAEYQERDKVDQQMYDLYHGSYTQELPKHIKTDEIKTGYATQFIDRVMGIFTHDAPTLHMDPVNPLNDESRAGSTKVEEFLNCLFPAMQQEADEESWHLINQDVLLYGRGTSMMPPAGAIYWKDYPKMGDGEEPNVYNKRSEDWKKGNRLPIAWRHVPAMESYPDTDDYGLAEICTKEVRTLRQITNQYEKKAKDLTAEYGTDYSRKMNFLKYANRDYLAYFVEPEYSGDPKLINVFPHKMEETPYVYIKGKTSSSRQPEHATKSLLYHMRPLILYLEKLLMQKGTAIRIWCWPQLKVTRKLDSPMGEDGNPIKRNFDLEAGQTIELLDGEDVSFLVWTGSPPDIDEQVATVQRYIDRMGLASVMYGTTAADASSGYAINTLIQAAQSLFGPIATRLSNGYAHCGRLALKNVQLLGQTVYVYRRAVGRGWVSLSPDDIQDYYRLIGKVKAKLPQELPVNAQVALQLTTGEKPLMDRNWARTELLDDESPDKTEAAIRLQDWKDSDQVKQFYTQKAIEMANMQIQQQDAAGANPQGPLAPALAQALGRPELAGPSGYPESGAIRPPSLPAMAGPGGILGQATLPMVPGVGMPTNNQPQAPGPQAMVNAAESQHNPVSGMSTGGRRPGAARQPGGAKKGRGVVP